MRIKPVVALLSAAVVFAALEGAAHGGIDEKTSPALARAIASAHAGDRVAAWVFFADKGADPARGLSHAEANLTEHARARRERNRGGGPLVDAYDLPVPRAYVRAVAGGAFRVRHASRWLNAVSLEAEPSALEAMAAMPFVARMDVVHELPSPLPDPDAAPAPSAPRASEAASFDYGPSWLQNLQIDVPALHDLGYTGQGVMIAMLDTGFNNLSHPAFQNLDILATWDFVNGDSVVSDEFGQMGSGNHGTYTLGTIGGFAAGELIGPAFGATYLLAKTENTNWERHIEEDAWIAGAEWADSIGADIISSSVGYSTGFTNGEPSYAWEDMDGNTTIITIGADIAASRGILVVNSAGNGGLVASPANTLISPSDGNSVLAVGAVDVGGTRASFSSVGPSADGRIKPDVMAMGVSVHTASPFDLEGYLEVSGTSLSCPLAAGAAALVLQARPGATNFTIMSSLRQTATQAGAPDRLYGWGVIDAAAAMNLIASGVADTPPAPVAALGPVYPNPFNPSTTIEYETTVRGRVHVDVFNVRGERVATLVDEVQAPGHRSVVWNAAGGNGKPLASGVYLVRLTAGGSLLGRKIVLLK